MQRMWIVEDVPKDIRAAGAVLTSMGVTEIEVRRDVKKAIHDIEVMLERSSPLPDGIVLDLNFGAESGFELLRLWHSTPEFRKGTGIVVWTEMSDSHQRLCPAFGVKAVFPNGKVQQLWKRLSKRSFNILLLLSRPLRVSSPWHPTKLLCNREFTQ